MKSVNYVCVFFGLLTLFAHSAIWSPALRLNDSAVTNDSGAIIVLGTEGSYQAGYEKEKVFDNNLATFFDPDAANVVGAWAGYELQSPRLVTRIRYVGCNAQYAYRMRGVLFQGANQSDFSDAVTLHTSNPPANWNGTTWVEVTLNDSTMLTPYKFLRFIANEPDSAGGNAAEVEFYGVEPLSAAPSAPTISFADTINWVCNFRWTTGANTMMVELQRKLFDEDTYTTVKTISLPEANAVANWRDPVNIGSTAAYRIRARNNVDDSVWQDITIDGHNAAQGLWIGTAGSWNNGGSTGDKAFDGDVVTFYDANTLNKDDAWSGLELSTEKMVTGVRYVPRSTHASHAGKMRNGWFEGADNADFNNPVLLHTITVAPELWSMNEVEFDQPEGPFRYLRYCSPIGGNGNVAEVEFDVNSEIPEVPLNLHITSSDLTNDYAVLAWDYSAGSLISSSRVYRATAPGGPYALLTPEGVFGRIWSDTDTNTIAGLIYYYRVALQCTDGNSISEGEMCAYRTHRRAERLDRDWSDLTVVKLGLEIFGPGPYQDNASLAVDKIFDNDFATYYDTSVRNPKPCLNFGTPCGVKLFRYAPRNTAQGVSRVNGARLFGDSVVALTSGVEMGSLQNSVGGELSDIHLTSGAEYQYWYVTRVDEREFHGNLSEMEFYGWPASNLVSLLVAPMRVVHTLGQTLDVALSWERCANVTGYRVERALHGSDDWTIITTLVGTNTVDSAVAAGVKYDYRVASVRDSELAYSDTLTVIPYARGSGTGLNGYYSLNFKNSYDPAETQVLVRVDSQINFQWAISDPIIPTEPDSVDNVRIAWYGQLDVPVEGNYTFHINSNDGCALRINGKYLINYWAFIATEHVGSITLSAGLHTIQVDYFHHSAGKSISLEWSGAVMREIIPASQLSPLDLPSDDIGAWQGRTINAPRLGQHIYNADTGAIEVYSDGCDVHGSGEGMHYLYQKIDSGFIFEADVDGEYDPLCVAAKSMLMVRADLSIGSALIAPVYMFASKVGCKARLRAGASIVDVAVPAWTTEVTQPTRLKIKRLGSHFEAWYKKTGGNWTEIYAFDDVEKSFGKEVYVGMAVCAPAATTTKMLQKGIFKNITLRPASGTALIIQ